MPLFLTWVHKGGGSGFILQNARSENNYEKAPFSDNMISYFP